MGDKSLPLLEASFDWVRQAAPSQAVTAGLWNYSNAFAHINDTLVKSSDIISFHTYGALSDLQRILDSLATHNRPIICTEWMARWTGSRIDIHLPVLKERGVPCYSWGLVNGRTQTNIGWDTIRSQYDTTEWFHDLFYSDGTPYKPEEIEVIRRLTSA